MAPMKQFDLAPPSSLARGMASFGRVHLTALGEIRELQQKVQDDNDDDDLFAVTPPSSLARGMASFGRVHLTALEGIRELQQKEQDDNGDDDLFTVTHLNP